MSDRAQRVLDALIEYDDNENLEYPILTIHDFFDDKNSASIGRDVNEAYQILTADEEKQVIQAFLELAY